MPSVPLYAPQDEDCLTVNVWTAAQTRSEMRPVMVWIYGGGFEFGGSADPTYDGGKLAQEGVVMVSFNYRLNVFGFLALPELDEEGSPSGNFGLQDQLAVLRWVKAHIAAFGGDPENVTIFGESAGAMSVGLLMSSPLAHDLFDKAIMESGAWWDGEHGSLPNATEARRRGLALEQGFNVTSVAALRNVSAATLNKATPWLLTTDPVITSFSPNIDNYVLPLVPATAFDHGMQAKVPVLAGFNAVEQFAFLPRALPHSSVAQFAASLPLYFGNRSAEAFAFYPASTNAQANASAFALVGDMIIREQTWEVIDTQSRALRPGSVYAYWFTYTSAFSPVAAHTAEMPFVFGTLVPDVLFGPNVVAADAQDKAFAAVVVKYWTNFAKTGNPNDEQLPYWPAYGGGGEAIMQLGNVTIAPIAYDLNRLRFLKSFRVDGVLPASWRTVNN